MISLPKVTLICVATRDVEQSVKALEYSCRGIEFAEVVLVSPYKPLDAAGYIKWDYIAPFTKIDDWNHYIVYHLHQHFDTEFCLLVHADGFVVHPESWKDEWLNYSYIGSPWDMACSIAIQGGRDQPLSRVGNSVGIKSHKLCKLPSEINLEWKNFNADTNEDTFLSCHNKILLEQHGMKFAPFEVAVEFGRETPLPENENINPFVFHKWAGKNSNYPRF